jgi:hypothetical protein
VNEYFFPTWVFEVHDGLLETALFEQLDNFVNVVDRQQEVMQAAPAGPSEKAVKEGGSSQGLHELHPGTTRIFEVHNPPTNVGLVRPIYALTPEDVVVERKKIANAWRSYGDVLDAN